MDESYSIKIDNVPDFRVKLITLIECIMCGTNTDVYSCDGTMTSTQIAEKFEHSINVNIKK